MTLFLFEIIDAMPLEEAEYIIDLLRIEYEEEDLEEENFLEYLRGLTYNVLCSLYNATVVFNKLLEESTLVDLKEIEEKKVLGLPQNIFDSEENLRIALYHMDNRHVKVLENEIKNE